MADHDHHGADGQPGRISLAALNAATPGAFAGMLAPVHEHAGWVAEAVAASRPFGSLTSLHQAMAAAVRTAPEPAVTAFLRGHPALSPRPLPPGATAESVAEQRSAGLQAFDAASAERLTAANAAFSARFGFPFILAVRNATAATILAAIERRLLASPPAEREEALNEIEAITWMRLLDRVVPAPTGGLSLHVLDTARARPAAGLAVTLWRPGPEPVRLAAFVTDSAGRSVRLLQDGALGQGDYEWRADTAAYFAAQGIATVDRAFLPAVTVRFAVWNPEQHHHVPILITPGSYMTYRGS